MNKKLWLLFSFFLFLVVALTSVFAHPLYINNATTHASGSYYYIERTYGFQVNCSDNYTVSGTTNATFQLGRPIGTSTNYTNATTGSNTVYNVTISTWYVNFTQRELGEAGTYNITWYCINFTGSDNATHVVPWEIARNNTPLVTTNITVYAMGGTQSNVTSNNAASFEGQGNPYADCWMGRVADGTGETLWGTTSMYRDGATWTKGSTGATSLGIASYTVKCNSTGNTNFTDNSTGESYTLTIHASGSGGGGGAAIYDGETTTVTPWQWQPPTWEIPKLSTEAIVVIVIIILLIASGKKKKR